METEQVKISIKLTPEDIVKLLQKRVYSGGCIPIGGSPIVIYTIVVDNTPEII